MKKYKMPNGKETSSQSRYLQAWKRLGKSVAELMKNHGYDYKLMAHDPDLLFTVRSPNSSLEYSVSVSPSLAMAIEALLDDLDGAKKAAKFYSLLTPYERSRIVEKYSDSDPEWRE